ncbi:MAG: cytidylyltransferase [Gallionellales bacterium 35-53-114]|jgi:CMP-N-acetylneuraminic acid synthetase|nr:MAG: cytidylyltransferase [Gallionellales bacterium 35-53-114]OYZ63463.1 MAG: cytidylyltransferase [Gallionellales bacterium 24-53-125]OZB10924.1 MAG: cytidylyltransferase [Gallionellales bacterium 39-52-133]HQS58894.1 acylneuraminate cytidylyltransferase family protein [Gallionellaceae bacterium]HQS75721.1 acylneuraminate cytidylyltransferase family protein [Gallionellaceae bacterium]
MKILGITLARGGSKSVPRKNIRPILGVPLIGYTIAEALQSRFITRFVVSTDDEEIRQVALKYGADAPFLRPAEFSTDTASSVGALQHAVNWVEQEEGVRYDYIIELMCTNPMKTVEDIDSCIEKLIQTGADSVIAVHRIEDHHPIRIKKIVDDRIVDFCLPEKPETRRQDLKPNAYVRSGSIYALRRDHLMVEGRRYGSVDSRPYILPDERAVNVDTEIDFLIAENLLQRAPRTYIKPRN